MATAGRILIMPRGNWAIKTTYEMLDLVKHNGTSWLAKKTSVGIEPSNATEEYWHNVFDMEIANNLVENVPGKVLDAYQGKVLKDSIDSINNNLARKKFNEFEIVQTLDATKYNVPITNSTEWKDNYVLSGFSIVYSTDNGVSYTAVDKIYISETGYLYFITDGLPAGTIVRGVIFYTLN